MSLALTTRATAPTACRPGKAVGLVLLLGYFLLLCASVMLLAAGLRAWRDHVVASRWVEAQAQVRKCALGVYYPFARDGGGITYSLRCHVVYDLDSRHYESDFRTISTRSLETRSRIDEWIAENGPGTALPVRINPSAPGELEVQTDLPLRQFATTRDHLLTTLVFAAPGFLLLAIGRKLVRRAVTSPA